jgi:phage anti-repressor protein
MSQMIQPKTINFTELVKNSNTTLSLGLQTKIVDKLNETFSEQEQHWYVANLYMYMNYHATNDYPINLEDVFKMIGFANKGNAMKTIKSNFVENEDYKIIIFRTEKNKLQQETRGRKEETVMLNIDTFKNLCMIAKTECGKEIRKYYVKLENIYNDIIKEEMEKQKEQLENNKEQLEEKQKQLDEHKRQLQLLQHKPSTHGFNIKKPGFIYLINDLSKPGHYKIGMATNTDKRLRNLNTSSSEKSLRLYFEIKTYDSESVEKTIHSLLLPFNIRGRREWFYFSDNNQVNHAISVMKDVKSFYDKYNFESYDDFTKYLDNKQNDNDSDESGTDNDYNDENDNDDNNVNENDNDDNNINETQSPEITETNVFKLTGQRLATKSGNFKGVFWNKEKNKWRVCLKQNYKEMFLGYYNSENDGAKVYNDYALYLNQTFKTNYSINEIENYVPNPRDIILETQEAINAGKASLFNGVSFDKRRNHYIVSIKYKNKTYYLGNNEDEVECAKLYNQQALYFNNTYDTDYVLNEIPNYVTVPKNIVEAINTNKMSKKSSQYHGVTLSKQNNKYKALLVFNKKQLHLGYFTNEMEAAEAYNKKALELNEKYDCDYKINMLN